VFLLRVTRLMHLLTAALVAAWPAGSASACCCATRPGVDADDCQLGCCALKAPATCSADPADSCIHCCPSASQRNACGCWHNCGDYKDQRDRNGLRPDSRSIVGDACLAGGWSNQRTASIISDDWVVAAPPNSSRTVRVLYGVWRN
jgi:hypothetical protein